MHLTSIFLLFLPYSTFALPYQRRGLTDVRTVAGSSETGTTVDWDLIPPLSPSESSSESQAIDMIVPGHTENFIKLPNPIKTLQDWTEAANRGRYLRLLRFLRERESKDQEFLATQKAALQKFAFAQKVKLAESVKANGEENLPYEEYGEGTKNLMKSQDDALLKFQKDQGDAFQKYLTEQMRKEAELRREYVISQD